MLGNPTDTNTSTHESVPATENTSLQLGFYSKLALTALASAAILYYSGPFASVAAREAFTQAYAWRYGMPSGLSYWTTFMPLREHVGAVAYNYGPKVASTVAIPATYKTVDGLNWLGKKIASLGQIFKDKPPVAAIKEEEVKQEIQPAVENKTAKASLTDEEIEALIASFELLRISDDELPANEVKIDIKEEDLGLTLLFENKQETAVPLAVKPAAEQELVKTECKPSSALLA